MSAHHFTPAPDFNPLEPRCPQCGLRLTARSEMARLYYPALHGTLHIHICRHCKAGIGYVLKDKYDPTEPYVVEQIDSEEA